MEDRFLREVLHLELSFSPSRETKRFLYARIQARVPTKRTLPALLARTGDRARGWKPGSQDSDCCGFDSRQAN